MELGEQIRQCRKAKNISQEQLAELVNVSRQTIYKWETGLAQPSAEKRRELGAVLGELLEDACRDAAAEAECCAAAAFAEEPQDAALSKRRRRAVVTTAIVGLLALCSLVLAVCTGLTTVIAPYDQTSATTYCVDAVWFYLSLAMCVCFCAAEVALLFFVCKRRFWQA